MAAKRREKAQRPDDYSASFLCLLCLFVAIHYFGCGSAALGIRLHACLHTRACAAKNKSALARHLINLFMIYTRFLSLYIITLSLAFAAATALVNGFAQTTNDTADTALRMELFSIPDVKDNPLEITVLSRTDKEGVVLEEIMFNGAP
jgi:hypothetical protein